MRSDEENYRFVVLCRYARPYEVVSATEVLEPNNPTLASYCGGEKTLVCVDENVFANYKEKIVSYFSFRGINHQIITLRASEHNKKMESVIEVCHAGKEFGLGRRSRIVAIGGGITMDIAGLAASLYRRGIKVIRVPTTLLGMIDAGVGIKWGVNFEGERNFLGAFYPPLVTINDVDFLKTVSEREMRCGASELVKVAIVRDSKLFSMIEEHWEELKNREITPSLKKIVEVGITDMIQELQPNLYEDELERLVDFGHGFSPAIEFASNHEVTHGEAVSIDMAICTGLAHTKGICSMLTIERVLGLLRKIGLPLHHRCCTAELLWNELPEIIAHRGGKLNMVVPGEIGRGTFIQTLNYEEITECLAYLKSMS